MKKLFLVFALLIAFAAVSNAQVPVPIKIGPNLPAACTPNSLRSVLFYKTGASNGLYYCSATNTWTSVSSAAGSGITTLNTLTTDPQTFATGTSGTDFAISSAGSTHTFNLPTASASVRGLLSSANFSTFNGKQDGIQFKDEGSNLGTSATVTSIDCVGAGIACTRTTNALTVTVAGGGTGDLVSTNNLSDVASAATSRTNLGLGNVDNTSDATKNAATATLTNKTLTAPVISTITNTGTLTLPTTTGTLALTSGNVATATALASNPTDCSANNYATTIAASGNLTCAQVSLSAGVTGNLPVTNLNSGTSASSTTYWRGDGTWATPSGGGGAATAITTGTSLPGTCTVGDVYMISTDGRTSFCTATNTWSETPLASSAGSSANQILGVNSANTAWETKTLTNSATVTWAHGTGTATASVPDASLGIAKLSATGTPSSSTYLRGDNTWATPGGSGTVTATGGSLTANSVVLGAGTTDTKVVAGVTTDGTSGLTLGVAGASVGAVNFKNATSGTVTVSPVTGALGTVTLSLPAATDTLVGKATTDTLTNKSISLGSNTIAATSAQLASAVTDETGSGVVVFGTTPTVTTPVIASGLTASGSGANNFSGSTGTFSTSSGANTLSGATTIADATTPSLTTASGKTNTGFVQVNGKTSGATKITTADATAQTVTISTAAQTTGASTLTIPDQAGSSRNFVFDTLAQTLTNKTISGASNTISNVNLASQVTGNLPVGNLNSGTNASSSTYWRGDGTWVAPDVMYGLTDGANIATNCALARRFRVTLGGNRTLDNPTNPVDGGQYTWEFIQDATGSRTITLGSKFAFGTDITSLTLTTGASKRDFVTAVYNATADKFFIVGVSKGY